MKNLERIVSNKLSDEMKLVTTQRFCDPVRDYGSEVFHNGGLLPRGKYWDLKKDQHVKRDSQ